MPKQQQREQPVPQFASSDATWRSLRCPAEELNLDVTLACGQSFRWRRLDGPGPMPAWSGVHAGRAWLLRRPDPGSLEFQAHPDCPQAVQVLSDYLRLGHRLADLYAGWGSADPVFRSACDGFPGVRLLRQDPLETLFSFICSANNNIGRISLLVERLCQHFGRPVCSVDDQLYRLFPEVEALCAADVESRLRNLGFGYRAAYIAASAKRLRDLGGVEWLSGLRGARTADARRLLASEFAGVGRKVADCVCLMSLDHLDVVPVDVHVLRIARSLYGLLPGGGPKPSLSESAYATVSEFFPGIWRPYAGWAQAVLFSADLSRFQHLRPAQAKADAKVKAKTEAKAKAEANRPETKTEARRGSRKRKLVN